MQVKSIAECSQGEHSAIFLTFIKLTFVIKIFVLSMFEWPFYCSFHLSVCLFIRLFVYTSVKTKFSGVYISDH